MIPPDGAESYPVFEKMPQKYFVDSI